MLSDSDLAWRHGTAESDVGGMKTLQRRWTTFLKAQLVCEDRPSGQRFNVLKDVFTLRGDPDKPDSTLFYGLFSCPTLQHRAIVHAAVTGAASVSVFTANHRPKDTRLGQRFRRASCLWFGERSLGCVSSSLSS
ncbi:hypothetical protein CRUP_038367 [Coryphaenoides rupestris]|nr:hypothetical protein CRUP_038367 [Coryphaenoides rupestris]